MSHHALNFRFYALHRAILLTVFMSLMLNKVNWGCHYSGQFVSPGYKQVHPARFSVDGGHVESSEATGVLDIHLVNPIQMKENYVLILCSFNLGSKLEEGFHAVSGSRAFAGCAHEQRGSFVVILATQMMI